MSTLEFEPVLVEEAVFLAMHSMDTSVRAWERERDALYRTPASPTRERAFRDLAAKWFDQLGLARPIESALRACPRVRDGIVTIDIRHVVRARDECSEVLGRSGACKPERLVLGLRPERFLVPATLEELALREFLHADDMLDPAFGFERTFDAGAEPGSAQLELVRDRFCVLWEARVQGRMARRADAAAAPPLPSARFRKVFGAHAPPSAVETLFQRAWSGALASYGALIEHAVLGCPSRVTLTASDAHPS